VVVYRSDTANTFAFLPRPWTPVAFHWQGEPVEAGRSNASSIPGLGSPAVGWNGTYYLVAWANSAGIVAIRLDANGEKVDPAPFTVLANSFGFRMWPLLVIISWWWGKNMIHPRSSSRQLLRRVRGSDGSCAGSHRQKP